MFDQPLANVRWPSSLVQLRAGGTSRRIGYTFDQSLGLTWPASLVQLHAGRISRRAYPLSDPRANLLQAQDGVGAYPLNQSTQ